MIQILRDQTDSFIWTHLHNLKNFYLPQIVLFAHC